MAARSVFLAVKVTAGLWTAVPGVLAVATGAVAGICTSLASVLPLAFLFGYAHRQ